MRVMLEDEYYKFLFPPRDDGVDDPNVDTRRAA